MIIKEKLELVTLPELINDSEENMRQQLTDLLIDRLPKGYFYKVSLTWVETKIIRNNDLFIGFNPNNLGKNDNYYYEIKLYQYLIEFKYRGMNIKIRVDCDDDVLASIKKACQVIRTIRYEYYDVMPTKEFRIY